MDQASTSPTSSGWHVATLSLMLIVLFGTFALIGLLVTEPQAEPTPATAIGCQEFVQDAIKQANVACNAGSAPTETVTTINVPASEGTIGFDYPQGWSVSTTFTVSTLNESQSWKADLVAGYFSFCENCKGPNNVDITMLTGQTIDLLQSYEQLDFNAALQSRYKAENGYTDVEISPTADIGGERYTVTGQGGGEGRDGYFETIYFEGPTRYAEITLINANTTNNATNEAWETVKGSLDFSGIQQ